MASLIRNADIAADAGISSAKLAAWSLNRSAGGFRLTNLANGVDPGDAVNKAQLDAAAGTVYAAGAGLDLTGTTFSVETGGVTLAMQADLAQSTFIGRAAAAGTGVPQALSAAQAKTILDLTGTNTGDQTITLTGDVTGSGTGSFAATIAANAVTTAKMLAANVTYAKIQDVAGLSVFGRSASASGVGADITAVTDGHVLRLLGTLGFGTITSGGIAAGAITTTKIQDSAVVFAKIQDIAGLSVIGRSANTTGVSGAITGIDGQVLRVAGTSLAFGSIVPAAIAMTTNRLLGRSATGAGEEIIVGTGLSLSGGTLSSTDIGGTVTNFSAGDLAPLFTTTEAATTTTPALSFILSTAAANTFFGNGTGSTATPTFMDAATARASLGLSGLFQPLDGDLTSLSGASVWPVMYYRSADETWSPVTIGYGLAFSAGILSTVRRIQDAMPRGTAASASTLVLPSDLIVEVTGTTNISAITLADGERRILVFVDGPLTLEAGVGLETLGGVDLTVTTDSQAVVVGTATGVIVTDYQDANRYITETFKDIFMLPGANIGFADLGGPYFDIGRASDSGHNGSFIRITLDDDVNLFKQDLSASILLQIAALTTQRQVAFPDKDGTFAYLDDIPTLGTDVGTFLATPSSANLLAAVTDETGTGALVFGTTPTIATPVINGVSTGTGVATLGSVDTLALRDANANIAANNFNHLLISYASAAATTTLTVASAAIQYITGSTTHIVKLPVVSTLTLGHKFTIHNRSTGLVTVQSSSGATGLIMEGTTTATCECIAITGTSPSAWRIKYDGYAILTGKKLTVSNTITLTGTDTATYALDGFTTTGANTFVLEQTIAISGAGDAAGQAAINLWQASLSNGNRIDLRIGKSWAAGAAAYLGYTPNATAANNRASIGFHSKTDILNVFYSGGVAVGSTTDPGDTNLFVQGKIIGNAAIRLKGYTVATLPAGAQGDTAFVTDALAPTFLATVVGGGAIVTPVFYNGTNWVGA